LQKRHMILRGLLIVATPYPTPAYSMQMSAYIYVCMEEETILVLTPDAKITHQLSSGEVRTRWGQCVAVCCSVLQCVAVCCSVLQCVAVCCSVLRKGYPFAKNLQTLHARRDVHQMELALQIRYRQRSGEGRTHWWRRGAGVEYHFQEIS